MLFYNQIPQLTRHFWSHKSLEIPFKIRDDDVCKQIQNWNFQSGFLLKNRVHHLLVNQTSVRQASTVGQADYPAMTTIFGDNFHCFLNYVENLNLRLQS